MRAVAVVALTMIVVVSMFQTDLVSSANDRDNSSPSFNCSCRCAASDRYRASAVPLTRQICSLQKDDANNNNIPSSVVQLKVFLQEDASTGGKQSSQGSNNNHNNNGNNGNNNNNDNNNDDYRRSSRTSRTEPSRQTKWTAATSRRPFPTKHRLPPTTTTSRIGPIMSNSVASSTVMQQPQALTQFSQNAKTIFASFLPTNQDSNVVGQVSQRTSLNSTEQQRLSSSLIALFLKQQQLLKPPVASSSTAAKSALNGRRRKRQVTSSSSTGCGSEVQAQACRLLDLVLVGSLFLLPSIPDSDITDQQNTQANAFANVVDICAGRMAKTLTLSEVCIDANLLNAIGNLSTTYYTQTNLPLTVKSLVGGIFPLLAAGGSASILHRYGAAVDFACGMFESQHPGICVKILSMCVSKAKELQMPSLFMSLFAENFGCGSSASYFDSVHCTLAVVDPSASSDQ